MSAGVQVVPTYRFDISGLVKEGDNVIVIEVSTTLERERAAAKNQAMTEKLMRNKVLAPTGIQWQCERYFVKIQLISKLSIWRYVIMYLTGRKTLCLSGMRLYKK